jgi:hypothetical protein
MWYVMMQIVLVHKAIISHINRAITVESVKIAFLYRHIIASTIVTMVLGICKIAFGIASDTSTLDDGEYKRHIAEVLEKAIS